jgi:hypothetical protein
MGTLARRALNEDEVLAEWSTSDRGSYEAAADVTKLPPDAELVLLTTAMGGG